MSKRETVEILNPNTGKPDGRIDAESHRLMRDAILQALEEGPLMLKDLEEAVRQGLPNGLPEGRKIRWHMMAVKLDMEARGELERLAGSPQRVRTISS